MHRTWTMTRRTGTNRQIRAHHAIRLLGVLVTVLMLTLTVPRAWAHEEHASGPAPVPEAEPSVPGATSSAAAAGRLTQVGFLALPGFNADVWTHNGFAYVGTWGTDTELPRTCPATGVRVIDLTNPRQPALIGAVATIPGTTQEDVAVARIDTPAFQGDLLVTGVQACARASAAVPANLIVALPHSW